jgi:hypothetical protein
LTRGAEPAIRHGTMLEVDDGLDPPVKPGVAMMWQETAR